MKKTLVCFFILFWFFAPVIFPQGKTQRIIAVADVHGAYEQFAAILKQAGVVDENQNWAGGKTIFVQTGDILDRGNKSREVMELLMKLEKQAPRSGGRAIMIMGNHEAMSLIGDLRYVIAEDYKTYAEDDSLKRLESAYAQYEQFRTQRKKKILNAAEPVTKEEWMKSHPIGFLEHRDLFSPKGRYGAWLRKQKAIAKIGSVLFLHGGISAAASNVSVNRLNEMVAKEITTFDNYKRYLIDEKIILPFYTISEMIAAVQEELGYLRTQKETSEKHVKILESFLSINGWLITSGEGPLWFRGYSQYTDEQLAELVPPQLEFHKVNHIIVGHTVQAGGKIRSRQNNGVLLIDTAMLPGYAPEGRASALEILNGSIKEIYSQN